MITMKEMCPYSLDGLTEDQRSNLFALHRAVNILRIAYKRPMSVSGPVRTLERHLEIYEEKNELRKQKGLSALPVPMDSMHLRCAAIDLFDPDRKLKSWLKLPEVESLSKQLFLFYEHFDFTPHWIHVQCLPYPSFTPASFSLYFEPYSREYLLK